jgi:hypothetical protein
VHVSCRIKMLFRWEFVCCKHNANH